MTTQTQTAPSAGWAPITVPIALPKGSTAPRTVGGFAHPDAPGLAIHQNHGERGEELGGWSVTHLASGYRLRWWATRELAERVALTAATLGDWTRDKTALMADEPFKAAVTRALAPLAEEDEDLYWAEDTL